MKGSAILLFLACAFMIPEAGTGAPKKEGGVQFSYKAIIDKSFKFETGRVIPLTFEQAVENDGDISADGNYFFYSSNRENGNFDIYLRNLKDITTVRLTNHPSKDIQPAVSPDGKRLAFISFREDPEGDLYVMKINPEKIIKTAQESITDMPAFDEKARNITLFQDPATRTVRIIKDASPAWSPDGEWIVFSSSRDGMENIWRVKKNGADMEKLTSRGGMYPRFSPDGKEIIFISYRDKESNGDVYILNLAARQERRVIGTPAIELYPSFMGNGNEIVYTVIDRDTNRDGKIDLRDTSVLYYKNLSTNLEYPLTTYGQSSFNARWLQIFGSDTYKGVLAYSEQADDNININLLPEIGIIPKTANAVLQYDLAHKYITESDDAEKHLMALERVYHNFRNSSDSETTVYVAKALVTAALKYRSVNDEKNARRILNILQELSKKGNLYTVMGYQFLSAALTGGNPSQVLKETLDKARSDKNGSFFIPYIMEEMGDNYAAMNNSAAAAETYRIIIRDHEKYKRIISVKSSLARLTELTLTEKVADPVLTVLASGTTYQQFQMKLHFLSMVQSERDPARRLDVLGRMVAAYEKNRSLIGLIYYSMGKASYDLGRMEDAKKSFQLALKNVSIVDIVYYRSSNYLGDIEAKSGRIEEAEGHYNLAVNRYIQMWKEKDIIERIQWLIRFYETYGERLEFSGNYAKAAALYKKYYQLMSFLNLRRFNALYNEYGARAHVLYIDAFSEARENKNIDELEKEYVSDLDRKKMDFDKAYIYGLGYVYAKKAIILENSQSLLPLVKKSGAESVLMTFRDSMDQLDWALFLDDTFVDPYILKSWIYQFIDLKRNDEAADTALINDYFPEYLWERNITLLEKTLTVNNEAKYRENEGNIHLNIANNFFLLSNYPRALSHYREALKYKKSFGSRIEEALFYFHLGYAYWQNGDIRSARNEINKALIIYESLGSGKNLENFKYQIYTLYRYFALFYRMDENYREAIKWYNRLLDFASANKLKVEKSRARFLQEIAYCYKELGNVDAAISYLDKARALLAELSDDEQKYKLKFRVMGLFSFSFLNLGQDAAVIGESKIYRRLDKKNNELLNIALHEEIYSDAGDYLKAVEYLQKKTDLLKDKKSSIDKVTMITTLNNQGYYYYRAGKYREARDYFTKAWALASDKGTNDLQGIFTSLVNLSNLYAFIMENRLGLMDTPQKDLDTLITAAEKYRENYSAEKYKIELDALEAKAKEKKEKVTDKERIDLKKQVEEKAREVHYRMDISLGILKFYRILTADAGKSQPAEGPLEIYKRERALYDVYADILKKFETGLENAKRTGNRKLEIKMLLNAGLLNSRLGDIDEANDSYKKAAAMAEKFRYLELQAVIYHEYGSFLGRFGEKLDEGGGPSASLAWHRKGTAQVERYPFLFTGRADLVKSLYDRSIGSLIKLRQWDQALLESEKRHSVLRVLAATLLSPAFSRAGERNDYLAYAAGIREQVKTMKAVSRSLENGEAPDSSVIRDMEKNLADSRKRHDELMISMEKSGSGALPFLAVQKPRIPRMENRPIYSLMQDNGFVYLFEIENGKTKVREFKKDDGEGYLKQIRASLAKDRESLVVLSDASLELLYRKKAAPGELPPFMYVPSVSGAPEYTKSDTTLLARIYFTGTGLQKSMGGSRYRVEEGNAGGADLAGYSALIDGIGRNALEPKNLLGTMLHSSLIIKNITESDAGYLALFMESASYSGVPTVLFTVKGSVDTVKALLESSETKNFSTLNGGTKTVPGVIAAGFSGIPGKESAANRVKIAGNEFRQYRKNMELREFERAMIHLKRWDSLTEPGGDKIVYYQELASLEEIRENPGQAKTALESAMKLAQPGSDMMDTLTLKQIYLSYVTGDTAGAEMALQKIDAKRLSGNYDYQVFRALQLLLNRGARESIDLYRGLSGKKLTAVLPAGKTDLLYAALLRLFHQEDLARSIAKNWTPGYAAGARDFIMAKYLSGDAGRYIPGEPEMMRGIFARKNPDLFIRDFMFLTDTEKGAGSAYPVLLTMAVHSLTHNNAQHKIVSFMENFNLEDITKKYGWIESALLLNSLSESIPPEETRETRISLQGRLLKIAETKNIPQMKKDVLYGYSLSLAEAGRYGDAYTYAARGEALLSKTDGNYVTYQLQLIDCETVLNFYDKAEKRVTDLSARKDLGGRELFILNLLKSRLELNRLMKLKEATAADAKQFDRTFLSSLDILDRNPAILKNFKNHMLLNQIFDNYVNYKMKTGNPSDSLVFTEIKKQINLRIKFPALLEQSPAGGSGDSMNLGDSRRLVQALGGNPGIQMTKTVRNFPLEALQNKISDRAILIYAARVGNDIFLWALGKNYKNRAVLDRGYIKLKQILASYNELLSKFSVTLSVSRDLENLFTPMKAFYEKRDTIIFATDNDLEGVPFEIMGSKNMLMETHSILYLSSLMSGLRELKKIVPRVELIGSGDPAYMRLEKISLSESGIPYSKVSRLEGGFGHMQSPVTYNSITGELLVDGTSYDAVIKSPGYLYLPSADYSGLTNGEFSIYNSAKGISGCIINDTAVHDLNNAYFIDTLYRELNSGSDLVSAYLKAKSALKNRNEFKHPAYWVGIRLYLNGL